MSETKSQNTRNVVVKTPVTQIAQTDKSLPVYCEICDSTLANFQSWTVHKSRFHRGGNIVFNRKELKTVATKSADKIQDGNNQVDTKSSPGQVPIDIFDDVGTKEPQNAEHRVEEDKPADVPTKEELIQQHMSALCSLLLEPYVNMNNGQPVHVSEPARNFIADQFVFVGLAEAVDSRCSTISNVTSDEDVDDACNILSLIDQIRIKRRGIDNDAIWKKCAYIEAKVLQRIGRFHAENHFKNMNGNVTNDEQKQSSAVSTNHVDNSQKPKKQKLK